LLERLIVRSYRIDLKNLLPSVNGFLQ